MKRQEMKDYTVYIYIINRELKYRNDSKFTFIDIFLFFNLTKNYEPLFFVLFVVPLFEREKYE